MREREGIANSMIFPLSFDSLTRPAGAEMTYGGDLSPLGGRNRKKWPEIWHTYLKG